LQRLAIVTRKQYLNINSGLPGTKSKAGLGEAQYIHRVRGTYLSVVWILSIGGRTIKVVACEETEGGCEYAGIVVEDDCKQCDQHATA